MLTSVFLTILLFRASSSSAMPEQKSNKVLRLKLFAEAAEHIRGAAVS